MRRTHPLIGAVMSAGLLCGCASTMPPQTAPARPASPAPETLPPSYDWHALILVPFGTLLKDMPLALTEVLVFHDATRSAPASEDKDCFTMEGASPPEFLGQRPDEYSLCFEHDRLNRIEASVRLPAAGVESLFSAVCTDWQRHAENAARTPESCEGREGSTRFSARLAGAESDATPSDPVKSSVTVSISSSEHAP
jgi:hypothetical protein